MNRKKLIWHARFTQVVIKLMKTTEHNYKLYKANTKTTDVCKIYCACACDTLAIIIFVLLYVNGNAKVVVFVVKRYAVRNAKMKRYASLK